MPSIMAFVNLTTLTNNPNLYTGSAFEFARRRGIVSMGVTQSVIGGYALFNAGADVIVEEFEPPVLDRYPIIPDEMYFSDVVEAGDRLKLAIRNPSAGTIGFRSALQLQDA